MHVKNQTLAAIPLFRHTEILHMLVGMGSTVLSLMWVKWPKFPGKRDNDVLKNKGFLFYFKETLIIRSFWGCTVLNFASCMHAIYSVQKHAMYSVQKNTQCIQYKNTQCIPYKETRNVFSTKMRSVFSTKNFNKYIPTKSVPHSLLFYFYFKKNKYWFWTFCVYGVVCCMCAGVECVSQTD